MPEEAADDLAHRPELAVRRGVDAVGQEVRQRLQLGEHLKPVEVQVGYVLQPDADGGGVVGRDVVDVAVHLARCARHWAVKTRARRAVGNIRVRDAAEQLLDAARRLEHQRLAVLIFRLGQGAALAVEEDVAVGVADLQLRALALHNDDLRLVEARNRLAAPAQKAADLAAEFRQRHRLGRPAHERAGVIRGIEQVPTVIIFANRLDFHKETSVASEITASARQSCGCAGTDGSS